MVVAIEEVVAFSPIFWSSSLRIKDIRIETEPFATESFFHEAIQTDEEQTIVHLSTVALFQAIFERVPNGRLRGSSRFIEKQVERTVCK